MCSCTETSRAVEPRASGRFWDTGELAELFHVHPASIRLWQKSGRLPSPVKIGRRSLWRDSDIRPLLSPPPTQATGDHERA